MPKHKHQTHKFPKKEKIRNRNAIIKILIMAALVIFVVIIAKWEFRKNKCVQEKQDFIEVNTKDGIKRIVDDSRAPVKKILLPVQTIIARGSSKSFPVTVKNTKNYKLAYTIRFNGISNPEGYSFSMGNSAMWFDYEHDKIHTLDNLQSATEDMRLTVPNNVIKGSYLLTLDVIDNDMPSECSIYYEKSFFVVVK